MPSVPFPDLLLAAVVGQLDGGDEVGESGEGAASVDLGELAGIADEDDGGPGPLGVGEDLGELAGADHRRFVDLCGCPHKWIYVDTGIMRSSSRKALCRMGFVLKGSA